MKKFFVLGLLAVVGFCSSCSNDFELTAAWQDIPVVYGFLTVQDSVYYIRVEKAFLDPNQSALDVAQKADSLYYDDALVQLERVEREEVINLQRVNGDDEGIPRKEGIFANAPNILYKFELADENRLEGGENVRLTVNRGDTEEVVSAQTVMLSSTEFLGGSPGNPINFERDRNTSFTWKVDEHAYLFDLKIKVHIEESDPDNPSVFIPKTVEWVLARNLEREDGNGGSVRRKVQIKGEEFFKFLGNSLDETLPVTRVFRSIDVEVSSGGIELLEFLRISQANTGITSSQTIPTYTNVEGGFGLFTSRTITKLEDLTINGVTRDSLVNGFYTKNLNFQ